jgi:tripartite-type tricarboxylate transporter receptor subunit TctC
MNGSSRIYLAFLSAAIALALPFAGPARAQGFPSKPIKIIVGFSPGGVPDIAARIISQKLSESWKQPVLVENRLGAGSNIAAQAVATSAPDGYTLLSVSSAHAISPAIYPSLPFDTLKDFSGITLTATGPALLIVSPSIGVKSVAELIALAKAKPGQLNYSSAGVGSGSHFAVELLKSQAGIEVVHVPYKGIPEALTETITGRVQMFVSPYASAINLVKEGRAKAIAVTSLKRMPDLPDLPTAAESGAPGYEWVFWYGLLAPGKTPRPVVAQLNAEITRILRLPEVKQRLAPLGTEPAATTPEEFDRLIADEVASFTKIARAANIKVE